MVTKVTKIEIVKPLDSNWNELGSILNDIQYETWRFSNKAMQMLWEFDGIGYEYFGQYKESLNLKEKPLIKKDGKPLTTIDNYIRSSLSNLTGKMNSLGETATIRNVFNRWKTDKADVNYGRVSVASYKRNIPIEISNVQMRTSSKDKTPAIYKNEKNYYNIDILLISQSYAKELGRKGTAFKLALGVKRDYQKAIVDRVMSGEYKLSMSKITRCDRKKKWYLNLAYTFEPEKKVLDENKIMGVDVGVNIPAYLAVSDDSYYRQPVGSIDEIRGFQKQIESRTRSMQRQRKYCGEGSIGHGVKTRIKPLEKLSGKIKRFKDDKNHNWSRYIVNEAIKNNCGVIQMEDLAGISESNLFLKTWTYYDLQEKIRYKAEEVGIKVIKIKPNHTSARCVKCGHIHDSKNKEAWRPTQDQFKCVKCDWGHKFFVNADWNAAKNIATKDIEKIITDRKKAQEKELQHNMKYMI